MEIVLKRFDDRNPLQVAYLSSGDIESIIGKVREEGQKIYAHARDVKDFEIGNIERYEENIALFMTTYSFLSKIGQKINKQVENFISPLLKFNQVKSQIFTIQEVGDFKYIQEIKVLNKFDYPNTKDTLTRDIYDISSQEEYFKYKKYLEETAGFSISRTALEDVLKKKGYLEDQVSDNIEPFIYKETTYKKSIVLPIVFDYDPSTRVSFVFEDLTFVGENGLLQTNLLYLMKLAKEINSVVLTYSGYARKIKALVEEEDFRGRYISTMNKESNKIKMTGLFQDNQGNEIDVVEELTNIFQLTDEEITGFVNSRKRNLVNLPEVSDMMIPIYTKEEIKFDVEYKGEGEYAAMGE